MWAGVRLASRMSNADVKQWLAFLVVAPLGLAFVAVPALVVQVFLILFWVIELAFWLVHRTFTKQKPPARGCRCAPPEQKGVGTSPERLMPHRPSLADDRGQASLSPRG